MKAVHPDGGLFWLSCLQDLDLFISSLEGITMSKTRKAERTEKTVRKNSQRTPAKQELGRICSRCQTWHPSDYCGSCRECGEVLPSAFCKGF